MVADSDSSTRFTAELEQRSRSFDAWAADYDRYRPSYPDALFDHIAARLDLPAEVQVVDLGAGTGKAARAMARRGWHVIAIEPGEPMLEELRAQAAREGLAVDARLASAEATGLADASVDLVTAAQSFHWFDKETAVAEMARIVRPGGGTAVFWNARADDRSAFLSAYTELLAKYIPEEHLDRREPDDDASRAARELAVGGLFLVDQRVAIPHVVEMSHENFIGYSFTASYVRMFVSGADERRLRDELRALLDLYWPGSAVRVDYDVDVYVGRRNAA